MWAQAGADGLCGVTQLALLERSQPSPASVWARRPAELTPWQQAWGRASGPADPAPSPSRRPGRAAHSQSIHWRVAEAAAAAPLGLCSQLPSPSIPGPGLAVHPTCCSCDICAPGSRFLPSEPTLNTPAPKALWPTPGPHHKLAPLPRLRTATSAPILTRGVMGSDPARSARWLCDCGQVAQPLWLVLSFLRSDSGGLFPVIQ